MKKKNIICTLGLTAFLLGTNCTLNHIIDNQTHDTVIAATINHQSSKYNKDTHQNTVEELPLPKDNYTTKCIGYLDNKRIGTWVEHFSVDND